MNLSEKDVIKHSAAIQISNEVNLLERKTWNILLANAYDHLPYQDEYQVRIKDLLDALGITTRNDEHIKQVVVNLMSTVVQFNVLGKDNVEEWRAIQLLGESSIKKGILTYSYGKTLRERLYNPRMYAKIKLSMQKNFNCKHSLALYELCLDYFVEDNGKGETPWISLEKYKSLMGIKKGEYKEFKELNKKTIKKPIDEINRISDLSVEVEFERKNRKVVALKFHIKRKSVKSLKKGKTESPLSPQPEKPNLESELYQLLTSYFCLSASQAREILAKYDFDYIESKLKGVQKKYNQGEVKNLGAYTYKSIKEGYAYTESQFEVEKKEIAQQKLQEAREKERQEALRLDYEEYIRKEVDDYKEKLSKEEFEEIREVVSALTKERHDGRALSLGFNFFFNHELQIYLKNLLKLPSFEQWCEAHTKN